MLGYFVSLDVFDSGLSNTLVDSLEPSARRRDKLGTLLTSGPVVELELRLRGSSLRLWLGQLLTTNSGH